MIKFYRWHPKKMVPNHIVMSLQHRHQLWFVTVWFSFFFLFLPFFSIYRDVWGTISWSFWCSEHWCRHLGNARKAKRWLWCVIISHRQSQWQQFIKSHLAVDLQNRIPRGYEISSDSKFILLSPLNDFFNVTFFNNTLCSPLVLSFVCIVWSVLCLFCLHYFFTHFIWFWVLVGLDFCPFQVDSSPPPFGKGAMAY